MRKNISKYIFSILLLSIFILAAVPSRARATEGDGQAQGTEQTQVTEQTGTSEQAQADDQAGTSEQTQGTEQSGSAEQTQSSEQSEASEQPQVTPTPVKAPRVTVKQRTLYTGYKTYTIKLKNLADEYSVKYKSSDKSVAKVSKKGVITPVSAGTATISVIISQNNTVYARKIEVTVKDPYYEVTASAEGIHIGESFTFKIKRYGYTGDVNWTLSEGAEQLANAKSTYPTKMKVTAKAEGKITLTVESLGVITEFPIYMVEGSGEVYVVSEDKLPYSNRYVSYNTYNKYTKDYYVIRSYLERLNTAKGGTLIFLPGEYTVTNTLCVPSNTQLLLFDGATIKKSYETGTSWMTATRSLFQLVSYTSAAKEGIYSGYKGEHDINIIGRGNAVIDLNYLNTCAIMLCHNKNITIKGITFKNMNTNHFIELDASTNVLIEDNTFTGHTDSSNNNKEAINIDTPDKNTGGFNQLWTSFDCTPNSNITIRNNNFIDLECGVGTHKYTEDKAHSNITISNNTFTNCDIFAIQAMNWDNPVIVNNTFDNIAAIYDDCAAVLLKGVRNPIISENTFKNLECILEAFHWKNTGRGKDYAITYNDLSEEDIALIRKNYLENVEEPYFTIYPDYGDFEENVRIEIIEDSYIR